MKSGIEEIKPALPAKQLRHSLNTPEVHHTIKRDAWDWIGTDKHSARVREGWQMRAGPNVVQVVENSRQPLGRPAQQTAGLLWMMQLVTWRRNGQLLDSKERGPRTSERIGISLRG